MVPVRRNIDTDELILWLDPSSPLSFIKSESINSIAQGKNLFTGTVDFTNNFSSAGVKQDWTYDLTDISADSRGLLGVTKVPSGGVIDPAGGTDTVLLQEDTNTSEHRLRFDLNVEGINSGPPETITYSLYVKEYTLGAARQIRISHTNTGPDNDGVIYDFATSTLTQIGTEAEEVGVIDAGSGWYRIYYTLTFNGLASNQATCRTYIYLTDGLGNVSYAGDGSSGVYIWGPQWEEGTLSNYSPRPSNEDFKAFQNRKLSKISLLLNPQAYTTSFEGTNLRFSGSGGSVVSVGVARAPFRPDGSILSLQNHTGFAWVKLDRSNTPIGSPSSPNLYTVFGKIGGRDNNGLFGIDPTGTQIIYKARTQQTTGSQYTWVHNSNTLPNLENEWHFIAFSYDIPSKTASFYLDGQFVGSETAPSANPFVGMQGSNGGMQLGQYTSANNLYGQFCGLMNIVGFYNKALSPTEHEALYNATKYRFYN
jgi:hypothetical protein